MYVPCRRRIRSKRGSWIAYLVAGCVLAGALGAAAGCAAMRVPEEPPRPTPMGPVWSEADLRDHLEFLNDEDLMGRATGTQGYARAAAYVAARMREFRLQPSMDGEYRVVYGVSINYPVSSTLSSVGPLDSTAFLRGIDYLPDARSDSGRVRIDRLMVASSAAGPPPDVPPPPFGVLFTGDSAADLFAWQQSGARLAVFVRDLRPRFHPAPIPGLLVVQTTPRAAAELLGVAEAGLPAYLAAHRGGTIQLPRVLTGAVSTDYLPGAGAINMMGYFSGKHPTRQRDLVILCADLDAVGTFAGVPAVDFGNFGIATSAVLEVARSLSYVTRRWSIPDRSVMVAIWSGSQTGHVGLRYFLEHPTWSLDRVKAVVYVGLSPDEEADVRRILDGYGIPLTAVGRQLQPLFERDVVLQPDPSVLREARARYGDLARIASPDRSAILDSAVVRARRLADEAYGRTVLHATDSASFLPARGDTLAVPAPLSSQ